LKIEEEIPRFAYIVCAIDRTLGIIEVTSVFQ